MIKILIFVIAIIPLVVGATVTSTWTWIAGNTTINGLGNYGVKGVPSSSNYPPARRDSDSKGIQDSQNNFYLFGGTSVSNVYKNDLWKYSNGIWTWIAGSNSSNNQALAVYGTKGVAANTNTPGARTGYASWVDSKDNIWIYGGQGYTDTGGAYYLSDLWMFNGYNWTWVSGSQTGPVSYGTKGTFGATNQPGPRYYSSSFIDSEDNLYLFGGASCFLNCPLNDMWKFDGIQWAWIHGPNGVLNLGNYGTKGVSSVTNVPPSSWAHIQWKDSKGDFWIYGGQNATGGNGGFGSLWRYSKGNWTWITGLQGENLRSYYGPKGVPSSSSVPGSRRNSGSWIDSGDNLYFYGGFGYGNLTYGYSGDLWKWDGFNWTYISGHTVPGANVTSGTLGISDGSVNNPGGRDTWTPFKDEIGNFYLFGGFSNLQGRHNDFWRLEITPKSSSCTILKNGGFELSKPDCTANFCTYDEPGTIEGWYLESGSVDVESTSLGGIGIAKDGDKYIDLTGYTAGVISQTAYVTPGIEYKLTFWMAGNYDGAPAIKELLVQVGPAVYGPYSFNVTGITGPNLGWVEKNLYFQPTTSSVVIKFKSLVTTTYYGPLLDAISVVSTC